MSFILEALKKSARERERGEIPSLDANHQTGYDLHFSRSNGRPIVKWIILLSVTLLSLLCLGAWYSTLFSPSQDKLTTSGKQLAAVNQKPSQQAKKTASPAGEDVRHHPAQAQQRAELNTHAKREGIINESDTTAPRIEESSLPEDAGDEEQSEPAGIASKQNLPPLLNDLPDEIRSNIPEIKFAGHAYSDNPAQRMIIINQKIVRENDIIEPRLTLEAIVPNGIILNYDSTRFRVDMFE